MRDNFANLLCHFSLITCLNECAFNTVYTLSLTQGRFYSYYTESEAPKTFTTWDLRPLPVGYEPLLPQQIARVLLWRVSPSSSSYIL